MGEIPLYLQIKSILSLKDTSDHRRQLYSKVTLEKAICYSLMAERVVKIRKGIKHLPEPELLPGSNGSIDVVWKGRFCERGFIEPYRILLNVPIEDKTAELFYLTTDGKRNLKTNIYLHPSLFYKQ